MSSDVPDFSLEGMGMSGAGGDPDAMIYLQVQRHFKSSAEQVFDAWVDPAIARKWFFATPGGEMQKVEIDGKAGGRFTIVERREGVDVEHVGKFFEVTRPSRLVFTFSVPTYSDGADLLRVDIAPAGEGCDLTINHEVEPAFVHQAEMGWRSILETLAGALGET